MRIFIAGGSGAIGRYLVPLMAKAGHEVVALSRSESRAAELARMGADPVVGDVYDEARLAKQVMDSRAEVVIHQLTAFGTKDGDPYAETIRLRIDGTRSLVAAAQAAGATRFIAQSISFICTPHGEGLSDEDTPIYLGADSPIQPLAEAVASLEQQTLGAHGMTGTVLRYGWFYGPGTGFDPKDQIPAAIRKGAMPVVGDGGSTYSFINLKDAAAATMTVLASAPRKGVYNIVDDTPVRIGEWLPYTATLLGAPAPGRIDVETARRKIGAMRTYFLSAQRGASNAKAKRDFGWRPACPSWRAGFEELYSGAA